MDGCDGLLVCGIDGVEGFAINAFDEFVVDEPRQSVEADGAVGGTECDEAGWGIAVGYKKAGIRVKKYDRCRRRLRELRTYNPVGCSYFPVWGVSRVTERDMIDVL